MQPDRSAELTALLQQRILVLDGAMGTMIQQHGLQVLVPDEADRVTVHRIIFEELCLGKIVDASRHEYRRVMQGLIAQGAQAIILGCTEITLLVCAEDASVPLFDTTGLHALAAAEMALLRTD